MPSLEQEISSCAWEQEEKDGAILYVGHTDNWILTIGEMDGYWDGAAASKKGGIVIHLTARLLKAAQRSVEEAMSL